MSAALAGFLANCKPEDFRHPEVRAAWREYTRSLGWDLWHGEKPKGGKP